MMTTLLDLLRQRRQAPTPAPGPSPGLRGKTFVLILRGQPVSASGPNSVYRLKRLLKASDRVYGFDCIDFDELVGVRDVHDARDFITAGKKELVGRAELLELARRAREQRRAG